MAYVRHAQGGASIFVDGECVGTVSEAAEAHLPLLCNGYQLDARALAPALQESSGEIFDLVKRLVQHEVLWAEL